MCGAGGFGRFAGSGLYFILKYYRINDPPLWLWEQGNYILMRSGREALFADGT